MSVKKTNEGWKADIRPNGRTGKRFRKSFPTKAEAIRYEAFIKTKYTQTPDWEPPSKDKRRLSNLIKEWYKSHGKALKSGSHRLRVLEQTCTALGNPYASSLGGQDFTNYRSLRMESGISANTVNHELAYLRAVFNELSRTGEWSRDNPLSKVRQVKTPDTELCFLSVSEIKLLLIELGRGVNPDARKVALICLATGCRWSEAELIRAENVHRGKIVFVDTKSGKNRSVPISEPIYESTKPKGIEKGELFSSCYSAFRHAIKRSGIALPDGQLSHVLRHTFASHFMMNGGNILVLQRILGHANLTMTMRYAHFSPDHLEEAIKYNPIKDIELID